MEGLAALLKPPPFVPTKQGDPEQLLQDWLRYVDQFKDFLNATKADGDHSRAHADCDGCSKAKAMLRLIGGEEVKTLLKHTGQVEDEDSWDQVLTKVEEGIRGQTNQAVARHKLFTMLRQEDRSFSVWYPKVREQAKRCNFEDYTEAKATRDAILFLTSNQKLQQKILAEDLSYDDTVKYGLALEQSKKKIETINAARGERQENDRVAKLEEEVRALKALGKPGGKQGSESSCGTCTRPTHGAGKCPAKEKECFACGKSGHFQYSKVCSKKEDKKKFKKKTDSRKVEEENSSETESDCESTGRVIELGESVRAIGAKRSEKTHLKMEVQDHGVASKMRNIEFIIDTGVNKTLLSEEEWRRVQAKVGHRNPKLKRNRVKFVPFGTNKKLECLGRSKCELKAEAGAAIKTLVYVMKDAKESLLGLHDARRLGIVTVKPTGKAVGVRKLTDIKKSLPPGPEENVSGGQTQAEVDMIMGKLADKFPNLFMGLGRAIGVDPVHVYISAVHALS